MWIIIIILYVFISFIDIRFFAGVSEKGKLPLYITIMATSCTISIASGYVIDMPSPSGPIKDFVLTIIGS